MTAFIILLLSGSLVAYSSYRCEQLDIATGRRDPLIATDDYGSNRGFYWPWSPVYLISIGTGLSALCYLAPSIIG